MVADPCICSQGDGSKGGKLGWAAQGVTGSPELQCRPCVGACMYIKRIKLTQKAEHLKEHEKTRKEVARFTSHPGPSHLL